jgi:TolA-binding protein
MIELERLQEEGKQETDKLRKQIKAYQESISSTSCTECQYDQKLKQDEEKPD